MPSIDGMHGFINNYRARALAGQNITRQYALATSAI